MVCGAGFRAAPGGAGSFGRARGGRDARERGGALRDDQGRPGLLPAHGGAAAPGRCRASGAARRLQHRAHAHPAADPRQGHEHHHGHQPRPRGGQDHRGHQPGHLHRPRRQPDGPAGGRQPALAGHLLRPGHGPGTGPLGPHPARRAPGVPVRQSRHQQARGPARRRLPRGLPRCPQFPAHAAPCGGDEIALPGPLRHLRLPAHPGYARRPGLRRIRRRHRPGGRRRRNRQKRPEAGPGHAGGAESFGGGFE